MGYRTGSGADAWRGNWLDTGRFILGLGLLLLSGGEVLLVSNPFSVTTVRCAGPGCDAVRRDVNHWFVTAEIKGGFHCFPFDYVMLNNSDKPVCGQQCAQKVFEQWLTKKEK